MHTDERTDPLVDLGYEQRDIKPKIIFKVTMIFFGFAFVSYFLGWLVLKPFGYWKETKNVNELRSTKIPAAPNPILQTNVTTKTDMYDLRRSEEEELTTAGESTHVKGAVRIPIEQAIKLSAERGAKLKGNSAPVPPTPVTEGEH